LKLIEAFRIVGVGFEQKLGVDLNDSEQVVQLVGRESRGLVRVFERLVARAAILSVATLKGARGAFWFFQSAFSVNVCGDYAGN
jgi:hypothetical protein